MSSILPFVPTEQSYDPETLHTMGAAFDMLRRQQPSMAPERIASAIIDFSHKNMDADALCATALRYLKKGL